MKKDLLKGFIVVTVLFLNFISYKIVAEAVEIEANTAVIENNNKILKSSESEDSVEAESKIQSKMGEVPEESTPTKEKKMINGYNEDQYKKSKEKALRAGYTEEQFEAIINIPKLESAPVIQSRAAMTSDQTKVVNMSKAQLGKPYVWGAQGPGSFDCGGLVRYVYKNSVGKDIPMGTENQKNYGKSVSMNSLLPGDLLFWLMKGTNITTHVAIYIGNGQFIHSPQEGETVTTVNMSYLNPNDWYPSFARRILPEAPAIPPKNTEMPFSKKGINYESHVKNVGWMNNVTDGALSGSVGYDLPLEALKITFGNNSIEGSVQYRVHMRNKGWGPWINSGSIAGTTGQVTPLEAFEVKLTGQAANYYNIEYQAHVKNKGWLPVVKNGQTAGTTGQALDLQAMRIALKRKPIVQGSKTIPSTGLSYRSHLSYEGWLGYVNEGVVSGTTGLNIQLEKLEVFYNGSNKDIEIDSHIKNDGWVKNSGGTVNQNKWIEAIRIRTKNDLAKNYNIEYRVHSTNVGWTAWVGNGVQAGTTGQKLQIQAVQIRLLKK